MNNIYYIGKYKGHSEIEELIQSCKNLMDAKSPIAQDIADAGLTITDEHIIYTALEKYRSHLIAMEDVWQNKFGMIYHK